MKERVLFKRSYLMSHLVLALAAVICIAILAADAFAQAPKTVLINSQDWRDVYSGMLYAKLNSRDASFLVSEKHALIYLETLDKGKDYLLVEAARPYFSGFESSLRNKGYTVERLISANNNLALARRAVSEQDIKSFIVVDDSYGYLAIAAASYAVVSESFVLFADRTNIDDVLQLLRENDVESLTIIGHVDREVRLALEPYSPESIDGGSRFATNIEIVRRYRDINPHTQVVITNGEFIEDEVMSGLEPVVFIGKDNIPQVTIDYFKESDIKVAVLIGNDLIKTATRIRRELGVTTFVKFARSARIPSGTMSKVEGLDLFYLPKYELSMDVASARYNEMTGLLEVSYKNDADVGIFLRATITVDTAGGNITIGDTEPVFVEAGEVKTVSYAIEEELPKGAEARFFVVFGESAGSMEKLLEKTMELEFVRILDSSALEIMEVFYSKKDSAFGVVVENTGTVDVYASAELVDVLIEESKETIGSKRTVFAGAGRRETIYIRQRMSDLDLEDNPRVHARAYYGMRENAMFKVTSGEFDLKVKGMNYILPLAIAAVLLLLWIIIFGYRKKRKKKEVHVHHR